MIAGRIKHNDEIREPQGRVYRVYILYGKRFVKHASKCHRVLKRIKGNGTVYLLQIKYRDIHGLDTILSTCSERQADAEDLKRLANNNWIMRLSPKRKPPNS